MLTGVTLPTTGVARATFTITAAAELRQRVRSHLMAKGQYTLAAAIGEARIGTVNSVCGNLLARFAFEAGMPMQQRVLDEPAAEQLLNEAIDAVIDATHPFAEQISANAVKACAAARIPLLVFTRPPWRREPGDDWIEVDGIEEAVDALGAGMRTVFLTHGRLQLAAFARAQHRYVVRAIDRPADIDFVIVDRGLETVQPTWRVDDSAGLDGPEQISGARIEREKRAVIGTENNTPSRPPTSRWKFRGSMPAYDAERFSPPAPLASVACKNPQTGATWADMPMLIDTGADINAPDGSIGTVTPTVHCM